MLDKLKRRIPDAVDEVLLSDLLTAAGDMLRAYTARDVLPSALDEAVVQLACVLFNRMGMEGETKHTEGGIVRESSGLPADIAAQAQPYRLARTL